jgi:hypothetical protein
MAKRINFNAASGRPTPELVTEMTGVNSRAHSQGQSTGFIPISKSTRQIQNNSLFMF